MGNLWVDRKSMFRDMMREYHTGIYGHNDEAFRKIRKEWRKELIRLIFNEKEL